MLICNLTMLLFEVIYILVRNVFVSVWPRARLFRGWESAAGLKSGAPGSFSLHAFFSASWCWLTGKLSAPFQSGFNADVWLMRLTSRIIIRGGILLTICVSTDERTSQARGVKRIFLFTIESYRSMSLLPRGDFNSLMSVTDKLC